MAGHRHLLGRLCLCAFLLLCGSLGLTAQQSTNHLDAARVVLGPFDPPFQQLIDLDGNARLDALGMTRSGSTAFLRFYQNQGDGTFASAFNHTISWATAALAYDNLLEVADFDGDGRRDDIAIGSGLQLRLFQANSLGLSAAPVIPLPSNLWDILPVDLDQNGSDDLVAISQGLLSITLNPLSATPSSAVIGISNSFGASGQLMAIHRVNGTVSLIAGTTHVVYTPGAGLSIGPAWGVSIAAGNAMSGDLDGDGDEDGVIFTPNRGYQRFIQDSSGNIVPESLRTASQASQLVDLDGDGDLDAVYAGGATASSSFPTPNDSISYFEFSENDGNGIFGPVKLMRGFGARRLAGVSDLDGDGDLDLAAGRAIYYGKSTPILARPFAEQTGQNTGVIPPNSLDLDLDGDPDVGLSMAQVFKNDGSGNFSAEAPDFIGPIPVGINIDDLVLGDWNQDGSTDLIYNNGSVPHVAFNLGGGTMAWYPNPVAFGNAVWAIGKDTIVADLDNDGDLDCIGFHENLFTQSTLIAIQSAPAIFTSGATLPGEIPVGTADIDNDGLLDIITVQSLAGATTAPLRWSRQGPLNTFSTPTTITNNVMVKGRPLLRDLDGDGDTDIVALLPSSGHVLLTNDGVGNFTQSLLVPVGTVPPSFLGSTYAVVEVTGDGIDDLLVSPAPDASGCSILVQGTGTGLVATNQIYAFVPSLVADVDGDGDEDLVDTERLSIHPNQVIDGANKGFRQQFGVGAAGTAGLVPTLGATGPFREGQVATLRLRNALGNAICYFVFSTVPATLPNHPIAGMVSYVDPLAPSSVIWPPFAINGIGGLEGTGTADLPFFLPVGVAGLEIHHQAFLLDIQGASGISASEGLVIRYGL